jgi:seryl-tRNA(Sec) selenium transferase
MTGVGKRTEGRDAADLHALRVINASGHMTSLGGSTLSAGVVEAMRRAAGTYCDMERLHDWAAETIVRATGADAALVVASAAAGIALSVAAVIVGNDPRRARQLPTAEEGERRIVIQAGHLIDFGAEVAHMIRLGGGSVVAVGSVNRVDRLEFEAVMRSRPAGCVFVQSHHAVVVHLREWTPPVFTRDHRMGEGILAFDPRPLSDADADVVVTAVEAFFRA